MVVWSNVRTTNKKCVVCALKVIYADTTPLLFAFIISFFKFFLRPSNQSRFLYFSFSIGYLFPFFSNFPSFRVYVLKVPSAYYVLESLVLQIIIVIEQKVTFFFLYSLFIYALLCCFSIFWAFLKLCFYIFYFIFLMSFYGAGLNAKTFDVGIQWLLTRLNKQYYCLIFYL